jgi:hypothetical protein
MISWNDFGFMCPWYLVFVAASIAAVGAYAPF